MSISAGKKPGKGVYQCIKCRHKIILDDSTDTMPPCPNCHGIKYNQVLTPKQWLKAIHNISWLVATIVFIVTIIKGLHRPFALFGVYLPLYVPFEDAFIQAIKSYFILPSIALIFYLVNLLIRYPKIVLQSIYVVFIIGMQYLTWKYIIPLIIGVGIVILDQPMDFIFGDYWDYYWEGVQLEQQNKNLNYGVEYWVSLVTITRELENPIGLTLDLLLDKYWIYKWFLGDYSTFLWQGVSYASNKNIQKQSLRIGIVFWSIIGGGGLLIAIVEQYENQINRIMKKISFPWFKIKLPKILKLNNKTTDFLIRKSYIYWKSLKVPLTVLSVIIPALLVILIYLRFANPNLYATFLTTISIFLFSMATLWGLIVFLVDDPEQIRNLFKISLSKLKKFKIHPEIKKRRRYVSGKTLIISSILVLLLDMIFNFSDGAFFIIYIIMLFTGIVLYQDNK